MPQIFVYFDNNRNSTLTMCEVIHIAKSKSLQVATVNPDSLKVLILIGMSLIVISSIALCAIRFLRIITINSIVTELQILRFFSFNAIFSAIWMLLCALATLVLSLSTSFSVNVVCMVFVISALPLISNHAAISGELFPTKYR